MSLFFTKHSSVEWAKYFYDYDNAQFIAFSFHPSILNFRLTIDFFSPGTGCFRFLTSTFFLERFNNR